MQESTLRSFLFSQVKPFKWHMVGLIIIGFLWSCDLSLGPYLIKMILDRMTDVSPTKLISSVGIIILAYICLGYLMSGIYRCWNLLRRSMMPKLKANIMQELTDRLLNQSFRFYQDHFAGNLSNKVNDVAQGVPLLIGIFFDCFVANFIALLGAGFILVLVHPLVCLIFIIWVVWFLCGSWWFARKAHFLSDFTAEKRSMLIGRLVDIFANMSVVHLFMGKHVEKKKIKVWSEEVVAVERQFDWVLIKMYAFQSFSFVTMQGVVMLFLLYARSHGLITIGDFVLTLTINMYIVNNLWTIGQQYNIFAEQLGKVQQGLRITTHAPILQETQNAKVLSIKTGEVEFERVCFFYNKKAGLFDNLSLHIKGGSKVGLVGHSGSGKTTFVNLILRLFDVMGGAILIDDQNIAEVTRDSLRAAVSFIPQDTTLFHRSILENIRYAKPDSSLDEVIAAAKSAHAHDFIEKLPDGYNSLVGERGINLSGGQRQRIAIARAILKNAPILILDEATSALDSITEGCIQDSLNFVMKDRTVIVIAHRLSTLLTMDEIIVLNHGKVEARGTHSMLLKQRGIYKEMWDAQVCGFLPD